MKEDYNPFKLTALHRNVLSAPMQILKEKNLLKGTILDYGCGHGDCLKLLQKEGYNIFGYDKYNLVYKEDKLLENHFDTITCNYVFNVIPSLQECSDLLEQLHNMSDDIYIAVRSDVKAKQDNWEWNDREQGNWTSRGSFQRFYNEGMIDILFQDVQYIHNGSDFKLFKIN